ncbi:MAG: TrmB family transcriptional regulator [Candidatus Bathyarchaeota archaeon]|nr:TrmB family transcriptional regulator [Candidatus Bathyarchaeota archaeon]
MTEPVSERAKTALREIGLTEYETRAYLHLLRTGATTASQISEDTDVPYSKIYEVLNSLEKKGWTETRAGRPRRYYPKSPVEALEVVRLRLEDTMKTWRRSAVEELQPLYDKREIREKPDVWILRGEFDTIAKLKELIGNAENELMIAVPALTKPLLGAVLPVFRSFVDTNVKLFIMVSKDQGPSLDALSKIGEVRVRDSMFGGGIIADGREALLILGEKKPSLIIWSDHIGLVKFAKDYFQHLWNTAEKIEKSCV